MRGYEAAGASAIQLEDQEMPKKCGHTPGRRVIPIEDMVLKVKVAVASRQSADTLIIARTDARTTLGLDEALRRGEAYGRAGADIVFIESPESAAELETIGRRLAGPAKLLANVVQGGRTPEVPADQAQGVRLLDRDLSGFGDARGDGGGRPGVPPPAIGRHRDRRADTAL